MYPMSSGCQEIIVDNRNTIHVLTLGLVVQGPCNVELYLINGIDVPVDCRGRNVFVHTDTKDILFLLWNLRILQIDEALMDLLLIECGIYGLSADHLLQVLRIVHELPQGNKLRSLVVVVRHFDVIQWIDVEVGVSQERLVYRSYPTYGYRRSGSILSGHANEILFDCIVLDERLIYIVSR